MKKVISFYLKIFLFTGIFAMVLGGIFQNIEGNEIINGLLLTMGVQLSPMFAFLVTKKKTKDNINFKLKIDKWFILSILMPILILSITALILQFIGIKYQSTGYIGITLIIAILTTIIGSVGEEIGWRGYLQNELNKKYSLFVSSAVTGLMWGAWHFFKIMNNGIISYLLFIPTIFLFGIIMGYIYNKSNKSLINMIAFHSFVNLSTILMLFNRECNTFYITLTIVNLIVILVLWLNDREYFKLKRESVD